MKLVVIESPYAGDVERNIIYARRCVRDSLSRNEAPIASHLLYTQEGILDDLIEEERNWGIQAGLVWASHAELTAVYVDYEISTGMQLGIDDAIAKNRDIETREIGKNPT